MLELVLQEEKVCKLQEVAILLLVSLNSSNLCYSFTAAKLTEGIQKLFVILFTKIYFTSWPSTGLVLYQYLVDSPYTSHLSIRCTTYT